MKEYFLGLFRVSFSTRKCFTYICDHVPVSATIQQRRTTKQAPDFINRWQVLDRFPFKEFTCVFYFVGTTVKQATLVRTLSLDFTYTRGNDMTTYRCRTLNSISPLPKRVGIISVRAYKEGTSTISFAIIFYPSHRGRSLVGMTDRLRTTSRLKGRYGSSEDVAIFLWTKELTTWFASTIPK